MMPIGLISEIPPFSSMQIQHVEGGFLCVVPPSPPHAAKTSGDVAASLHLFLGEPEVSERSSATLSGGLDLTVPVKFVWPEHKCPQGSVFSASKIPRIDSERGNNQGFMLTYHAAAPGTAHQVVAFNRATLMDRLKLWLAYDPAPREGDAPTEIESVSSLLTLAGMRPNPDMDIRGDTVFLMEVMHCSQIDDYTGGTPYVAQSDDPRMRLGLADAEVLSYVVDELEGDMGGVFAARIEDGWLEFGPRVEGQDG